MGENIEEYLDWVQRNKVWKSKTESSVLVLAVGIYSTVTSTANIIYKKINIHSNMGRRGQLQLAIHFSILFGTGISMRTMQSPKVKNYFDMSFLTWRSINKNQTLPVNQHYDVHFNDETIESTNSDTTAHNSTVNSVFIFITGV
jgi:hypothetical protein